MQLLPEDILYEDNHLIAVSKPAGVLSMGDSTGDESMTDRVAEYLKIKYSKPGNVFVGVVHRLDRPVSGVLLFARTSKAASRLSDQFRRNATSKLYAARVLNRPPADSGTLTHWLRKDRSKNRTTAFETEREDAKKATLRYTVVASSASESLLFVQPQTGRSHQIRVQLASMGCPISGDLRYGARQATAEGIGLHAVRLAVTHPTTAARLELSSPIPERITSGFARGSAGRPEQFPFTESADSAL